MEPRERGGVSVELVPPDVVRYRWRGDVDGEALELLAEYTEAIKTTGVKNVFLLCLVHQAGSFKGTARKKISDFSRQELWHSSAIVGASFQVRVMIELIINASRLINPKAPESRFFDTEEHALEWFASLRAKQG